ncbi:hypothetical protein SAMN04488700_2444 [Carnobacterium iners]|uniref:Uncharacterized protein n=2 Tax=Carnobacterium iners TaxID=1073423 RepID=A0A1X7NS16_9LACT|nr:hypothetical protein SAMN04488114_11541 [Carnobacterium iners]SMH40894.1 hypothetical protein SAMN04488700_2444 [Carnobacterium iners]
MKEWHIKDSVRVTSFLVDKVTILKGEQKEWCQLVEYFSDYFSYKGIQINLFENQTLIPRRDFLFQILSPNDPTKFISLEKALIRQEKEFLTNLEFSPFYKQLVESWEELIEEVDFLNTQQKTNTTHYTLLPFDKKWIQTSLSFSKKNSAQLSHYEKLILQINVLEESISDKKLIIYIQFPEVVLSDKELEHFIYYLQQSPNGILYFIQTENPSLFPTNIVYKEKIRNKTICYAVKDQLISKIPSSWSEETFQHACNWYMILVDKYAQETVLLSLKTVDNLSIFIYVYSLFILTNTPVIVDLTAVTANIKKYFENLIQDKV